MRSLLKSCGLWDVDVRFSLSPQFPNLPSRKNNIPVHTHEGWPLGCLHNYLSGRENSSKNIDSKHIKISSPRVLKKKLGETFFEDGTYVLGSPFFFLVATWTCYPLKNIKKEIAELKRQWNLRQSLGKNQPQTQNEAPKKHKESLHFSKFALCSCFVCTGSHYICIYINRKCTNTTSSGYNKKIKTKKKKTKRQMVFFFLLLFLIRGQKVDAISFTIKNEKKKRSTKLWSRRS